MICASLNLLFFTSVSFGETDSHSKRRIRKGERHRRNRKIQPVIDGHIYALRNRIERCFLKLKHSRRLATRYDKTADSFLGFILTASIRLWTRHFVHTA